MAGKFEIYTDKAGEFRFRLKAANGQVIAVGEGYKSKDACLNGIESIKKNAPEAAVVDLRHRDDFTADLLRTCEEADDALRTGWADHLPAELRRELDDLLPDGGHDQIWAAAQAAALDAISGADA